MNNSAIEQALESNNEMLLGGVATKADIADLKAATKEDIANLRAELIKWMFLFWIGQSAVVLAIVKLVK